MSQLGDTLIIKVPAGGPNIPPVIITDWPQGGGYIRSEGGYVELEGRSDWGTPQVSGPATLEKHDWAIACHLPISDARRLGAMAKWQDRTYKGLNNDGTPKARGDGRLILEDWIEMVDSEPTPHSRTLLESHSEEWNSSYVYGFAQFSVLLLLPKEHRKQEGTTADGTDLKLITFTMEEL